jgi:hypothetical protein
VLPPPKIISQFASKIHIRKMETFGAYLAPRIHISKPARVKTPAVNASHSRCAGPHGSIAKGAMKINVVGRCI